jgi:hypothetical protein
MATPNVPETKGPCAGRAADCACISTTDARSPTANELHAEIATLYGAASRRRYEQVVALIEKLSRKAGDLPNTRDIAPSPEAHSHVTAKGFVIDQSESCPSGGGKKIGAIEIGKPLHYRFKAAVAAALTTPQLRS